MRIDVKLFKYKCDILYEIDNICFREQNKMVRIIKYERIMEFYIK